MPNILPVSDLRNYNEVLKNCQIGEPVFLTKNGRGKFVVMDIEDYEREKAEKNLTILKDDVRGSLHTYTVRGTQEDVERLFASLETIFFEVLPLSLEEIFISETEVAGYDIKKLIFG